MLAEPAGEARPLAASCTTTRMVLATWSGCERQPMVRPSSRAEVARHELHELCRSTASFQVTGGADMQWLKGQLVV